MKKAIIKIVDENIELKEKVERYEKALKEIGKYENEPYVHHIALFAQRTLLNKG